MKVSDIIPRKYFTLIPDKLFIHLIYIQSQKKLLNTRSPKTYSEKLQWIKMYGHLERYSKYVDKFEVRSFVARTIGKKYLIPLYDCYDSFDAIPFDRLPNQFVLKATHGSGYNFICKDKTKINYQDLEEQVQGWLNDNFYEYFRESQYKHVKPRLVCEKYLDDSSGELKDYKFYCFNGKPEVIEVHYGRTGETGDQVVEAYDADWKRLPFKLLAKGKGSGTPKPKKLAEMLLVAQKLAEKFQFVRVDLYKIGDKIYFGELTFTPGDAFFPFIDETDEYMGSLIDLASYNG